MLKKMIIGALFLLPSFAQASTLEVSGWIPYWRSATGTADALNHIQAFTEINPFVYSLKKDGTIVDNGKMDSDTWSTFTKTAQSKNVKVIPSIMSSDGATIHAILKSKRARQQLENDIAKLVQSKGFDGIDIDFEGKKVETRKYFSLFLEGTKQRLGKKMLSCTIESRTPPQILYKNIPKNLEYVNDFVVINKFCDRVKFMTYDQQNAVYGLNIKKKDNLYMPVADVEWVESAIRFAMKTIDKKKIMIGIPTYGYEYRVSGAVGDYDYKLLWTFNPRYATEQAGLFDRPIDRGVAGEMIVTYVPTSTPPVTVIPEGASIASPIPTIEGVEKIEDDASTSAQKIVGSFRYLTWSDAEAIRQKVSLAQKLGVKGVAIFKIDGGEDQGMWNVLPKVK